MEIRNFVLGDYQTNCYCLRASADSADCVLIDTGMDAEPVVSYLKKNKLNPVALILTHGHVDHIAGVELLRENFPQIKVAVHKNDADMLTNPNLNLSADLGMPLKTNPTEISIEDQGVIEFASLRFEILHTPGHTPGGISLYLPEHNVVFAGDAIFAGSIGRTDFPGGDFQQLIESIKNKILTLPEDAAIYPGHGPQTSVHIEKLSNPFITE